jgi:hypothetical protein
LKNKENLESAIEQKNIKAQNSTYIEIREPRYQKKKQLLEINLVTAFNNYIKCYLHSICIYV